MDLPEDIIVLVLLRLVELGVSEPRVMVLEVEEMLHYLRLLNTASLGKYRVFLQVSGATRFGGGVGSFHQQYF